MPDEKTEFFAEVIRPHKRVNPCFMTGKGCVYTEIVDREIEARRKAGSYAGFLVVPYQPNLSSFFELCFNRYLRTSYSPRGDLPLEKEDEALKLIRADQVRRTGYVICEKICKKVF